MGIRNSGASLLGKLISPFGNLTKLNLDLQKNELQDDGIIELGKVITGFQLLESLEMNCYR